MEPKVLLLLDRLEEPALLPEFIPQPFRNNSQFHILVILENPDLGSSRSISREPLKRINPFVTVFHSPIPMGYGGNQKIGFHYAIQNGYERIIHVPVGNQISTEILQTLLHKWDVDQSDFLLFKDDPSSPLSSFRNWLLKHIIGKDFFGMPRGIRAYSTQFLLRIPFELNPDTYNFDTDILLQALALEVPIAAIHLPDSSQTRKKKLGIVLSWQMLKSCVKFRFQRIGFFCSLQYRGLLPHEFRYNDKSSYAGSTHQTALTHVRTPAKVLDLGCGPGFISKRLKDLGCYVVGLDAVLPDHYEGDRFIQMDLEKDKMPEDISAFDYVLLLDVLEHLGDPEKFLINCRYALRSDHRPNFVFSTGNVAFLGVRLFLGMGFFNYGERGILDVTHKRLFTLSTFRRMLRETGYEIQKVEGVGIPFKLLMANALGAWLSALSNAAARAWPSLFAYQFIVEATPKPHSFMLLAELKDSNPYIDKRYTFP